MISNVELQYIGAYARKSPYPGDNYAVAVMNELEKAHNVFKEKFEGKKYSLILSNGEEFHFTIKSKNLAHLLGLDFKNLSSEPMQDTVYDILGIDSKYEYHPSYDYLKAIIERADEVIDNDSNRYRKKILNYFKVMVRSTAFSKISDFENFDFGVIDFDKSRLDPEVVKKFSPNSTKFIFTENNEILLPYSMMGFVMDSSQEKQKEEQNEEQKEEQLDVQSEEQLDAQSENTSEEQIDEPKEEQTKEQNSLYVPETLLLPQNFGDLINNQEFLLPIHLLVNDDNSFEKKSATASEKYKLLCLYKSLISTYCKDGAVINIFNDYENSLKTKSQEEKQFERKYVKC